MPDLTQPPRYPIPKPIRRSYEILPGWGLAEIRVVGKGAAIAAPFALGVGFLGGGIILTVVAGLAPIAIAAAMAYPVSATDGSLVDRLRRVSAFGKRPHTYPYDYRRPDDPA